MSLGYLYYPKGVPDDDVVVVDMTLDMTLTVCQSFRYAWSACQPGVSSTLTTKELQEAVIEYCIPADLHPCLPPPTLTMDKLSSKYIGGSSKKCFKEVTSSLKGWKKKFFLIDRRAISKAMPCRHTDTDVRDDLKEEVYSLPMWFETVVSKGDPIPNDQHPANRTTPPLAVRQLIPEKTAAQRSIEKPNTKIGGSAAPRKKRSYKTKDAPASNSKETASVTPIRQANPKPLYETTTSQPKGTDGNATSGSQPLNIEKEVVDLSENTRTLTPSINTDVSLHRYAVSSLLDTAYRLSEQYLEISSFKLQNACLLA
ncbi:hypothetical protein Tco_0510916 [Tanacetum coccineum]